MNIIVNNHKGCCLKITRCMCIIPNSIVLYCTYNSSLLHFFLIKIDRKFLNLITLNLTKQIKYILINSKHKKIISFLKSENMFSKRVNLFVHEEFLAIETYF